MSNFMPFVPSDLSANAQPPENAVNEQTDRWTDRQTNNNIHKHPWMLSVSHLDTSACQIVGQCAAPLSPSMTLWQRCHHNHHLHLLCPWIHQPSRPQLWFLSFHLALQWLHPPLVICSHRRMVHSIKFTPHLHLTSMIPPLLRHQPPAPAVRRQTRLPQSHGCWLAFYPTIPLVCANRTLLHLT